MAKRGEHWEKMNAHSHCQSSCLHVAEHAAVTDVLTGHRGMHYSLSWRQDTKTKEVLGGDEEFTLWGLRLLGCLQHVLLIIVVFALNSKKQHNKDKDLINAFRSNLICGWMYFLNFPPFSLQVPPLESRLNAFYMASIMKQKCFVYVHTDFFLCCVTIKMVISWKRNPPRW